MKRINLFLVIIGLIIFSCSKEVMDLGQEAENNKIKKELQSENLPKSDFLEGNSNSNAIELKADYEACVNFIENSDFSDHSISPLSAPGCMDNLDLVNDWDAISGAPSVILPECKCTSPNQNSWTDHLFLRPGDAVVQDITASIEQDMRFWLCYESAYSGSTGRLKIEVGNLSLAPILITDELGGNSHDCLDTFEQFETPCFSMNPNNSEIELSAVSMPNNLGVHVDNVELHCKSIFLNAISAVNQGNCYIEFSPDLSGPLNIVEQYWDFGDGNTSEEFDPNHQYDDAGEYLVTLTIIDDRGCCTTIEQIVDCTPDPCLYHICWSNPDLTELDNTLQDVDWFHGFSVDGVDYFFSQAYYIVGNYHEIKDEMLEIMDDNGIDYGTFHEQFAGYTCEKRNESGSGTVPGYFFEDSPVEIEHFIVTFENGTAGTKAFLQDNCN